MKNKNREERYSNDDYQRYAGPDFREEHPGRSDEKIYEKVCEALMKNPEVDASHIGVRVSKGLVILEGWISSRQGKRLAEIVIEDLPGVLNVRNDLLVGDISF